MSEPISHTPRPWISDARCIDALDGNIAVLNLMRGEAQSIANAHLIAAAPDLLEALQEIFGMFERGEVVRDTSKDRNSESHTPNRKAK